MCGRQVQGLSEAVADALEWEAWTNRGQRTRESRGWIPLGARKFSPRREQLVRARQTNITLCWECKE